MQPSTPAANFHRTKKRLFALVSNSGLTRVKSVSHLWLEAPFFVSMTKDEISGGGSDSESWMSQLSFEKKNLLIVLITWLLKG